MESSQSEIHILSLKKYLSFYKSLPSVVLNWYWVLCFPNCCVFRDPSVDGRWLTGIQIHHHTIKYQTIPYQAIPKHTNQWYKWIGQAIVTSIKSWLKVLILFLLGSRLDPLLHFSIFLRELQEPQIQEKEPKLKTELVKIHQGMEQILT